MVACVSCQTKNRVPAAANGLPQCANCQAKLPWVASASDADFAEVTKTSLPVLVDLWAPWCAPCRMVAPVLEKLAAARAGRLKVVKVNVDDNRATQAKFNAMSIPTLVLLRDGKEVSRQVGVQSQRALEEWLDRA